MVMQDETIRMSARVPKGLLEKFDEAADGVRWSRSEAVRFAMERFIRDPVVMSGPANNAKWAVMGAKDEG